MDCGQMMDSEYGVPFDYLGQGLRLSDEEITRLKDTNSSKLFAEKKLQLKSLDLVLGHESGVIILDDNYKVWPDHHKNLILMKYFTYFSKNSKRKSRKKDKLSASDGNGVLPYILTVLREIHGMFFSPNMSRDVRMLLREIRGQILKGCIAFFIDVDENKYQPSISNQAEELGAECTTILDSSVTHVVVTARTKEITGDIVLWAQLEKKILVHPWWIYITYLLWQRQPEDKFPTSN
ncbi:hypothetical protein EZV62_022941 [Acer yangbiense]|uniref:protein-serine/threonine phosphatase n=1 Tax=Acer yangbiense TaxID=1000413 RepID=A0A5C7H0R7_9ROSI|nr:hypothetical protein EZV62_022941 [Acer yangbiense]